MTDSPVSDSTTVTDASSAGGPASGASPESVATSPEVGAGSPGAAAINGTFTGGFTTLLGLEFVEVGPDRVVGRWTIRPELWQPYGIVHGGVYCGVIESMASVAGAVWLGDRGQVVGVNNTTDFLRAVRTGDLRAEATPLHRGRSQQLWQVLITDEQDRLIARGQVRLQNLTSTPSGA
ncbi:PaaI family thioesterase [Millisia brevis]|uniref:PaaI family thioesterase n=1 Tax=Millisia brevis TaxID=264148 RepID=UPI000A052364|nr:PaaI family thioesterase [Millisia brevis]